MARRFLLVTLLLTGSAASAFFGSGADRNTKLNDPVRSEKSAAAQMGVKAGHGQQRPKP